MTSGIPVARHPQFPSSITLLSAALGDGLPGSVPQHPGVVAVLVQLQHGGDDAFYGLLLVHDAAEVAQVLPALPDGLGGIGAPTRL